MHDSPRVAQLEREWDGEYNDASLRESCIVWSQLYLHIPRHLSSQFLCIYHGISPPFLCIYRSISPPSSLASITASLLPVPLHLPRHLSSQFPCIYRGISPPSSLASTTACIYHSSQLTIKIKVSIKKLSSFIFASASASAPTNLDLTLFDFLR